MARGHFYALCPVIMRPLTYRDLPQGHFTHGDVSRHSTGHYICLTAAFAVGSNEVGYRDVEQIVSIVQEECLKIRRYPCVR